MIFITHDPIRACLRVATRYNCARFAINILTGRNNRLCASVQSLAINAPRLKLHLDGFDRFGTLLNFESIIDLSPFLIIHPVKQR